MRFGGLSKFHTMAILTVRAVKMITYCNVSEISLSSREKSHGHHEMFHTIKKVIISSQRNYFTLWKTVISLRNISFCVASELPTQININMSHHLQRFTTSIISSLSELATYQRITNWGWVHSMFWKKQRKQNWCRMDLWFGGPLKFWGSS